MLFFNKTGHTLHLMKRLCNKKISKGLKTNKKSSPKENKSPGVWRLGHENREWHVSQGMHVSTLSGRVDGVPFSSTLGSARSSLKLKQKWWPSTAKARLRV